MKPVKRIEIVIDSPELPELLAVLEREGVDGYTVFSQLRGAGNRGHRDNDEPGGGNGNVCVLTVARPGEEDRIVAAVRTILRQRGGMCLVSDAMWVVH
jgi:hypothetical protein